ncbi:Pleckstrin homology domain-containing family M member 3 [Sarcoptes scabiei]|uniref:Pleckstrin homology domain-containing family M member 3 n=1 Tax=Sarcoptes scabiei TaxID=52283 RepID=A0A834V8L1_SARSC|nr:Pleckstrin homology domain-containing family M member 3 [Sarcoptes scabiei]
MDSIIRFATNLSTVDDHALDVCIKHDLSIELEKVINQLIAENSPSQSIEQSQNIDTQIIYETPTVLMLCDIIEAIFLHGFKEKLSMTVSNVFQSRFRQNFEEVFCSNFWALIKIFSHNQELQQLEKLDNVSTDIGRCRAWIRLSLNESLLRTKICRNLLSTLDDYLFQLLVDNSALNCWSLNTLNLLRISYQDENELLIATALDAMHLIHENKTSKKQSKNKISKMKIFGLKSNELMKNLESTEEIVESNCYGDLIQENLRSFEDKTETSNKLDCFENESKALTDGYSPNRSDDFDPFEKNKSNNDVTIDRSNDVDSQNKNIDDDNQDDSADSDKNRSDDLSYLNGNSMSIKSGWSTQPIFQLEESYNALLESYSTRAILSSTPDINDVKNSVSIPFHNSDCVQTSSPLSDNEFEIIAKNMLNNDDDESQTQIFLELIRKLANENGLDEQNYKCHRCGRPIGMVYSKCSLCHIDGHLYCNECHGGEESIVPAKIIYNWCFKKYPVAKHNKTRLMMLENDPIFDLKILSPNLYVAIPELAKVVNLRTQLFFLHAYLFTCQEQVIIQLKQLIWPHEHIVEHVHLYSLNDLQQIHNKLLENTLCQAINFARKHIAACDLCKAKGFHCEICKNNEILYPFDTETTRRCDKCKNVFHRKCYEEKYEKNNCQKCLRIEKKKTFLR